MILHTERAGNPYGSRDMAAVGPSLKKLRLATVPRLSIRQVAEKLGLGHSSYAFYENPNAYKKPHLPIDFARRVARVFAEYGVEPTDVMKLAGLTGGEAGPEAREIEAARPTTQFVSMTVALPSEAALRDMFRSILVLVPEGASKDEAADILARRLPAGLASIGPLALDPGTDESLGVGEAPPAPARDRPASGPSSHT